MKPVLSEVLTSITFLEAGLPPFLAKVLARAGFLHPTPIQHHSLLLCLHDPLRNLLCRSKSGTGKTIAYLLQLLLQLTTLNELPAKTCAIVLLPTR